VSSRRARLLAWGNRFGVWLYRRSGGRLLGRDKVLVVTAPGRRSGVPRSTCVRFLDVPDGLLVWGTASGAPRDPDWFRNLRAAAEVEVQIGTRRFRVRPRELHGAERDAIWRDVVLHGVPAVARYESRAGRTIPVALLERQT
jgi:deazaflavin-dependent oxidoreductase (nitroreductase family)